MTCKCNRYDYDCKDCTDAWELSRWYGCYESPNPVHDIEIEIDIGDCVEANQGGERFWLQVTDTCNCFLVGVIVSDLHFEHPFVKGDCMKLTTQQIYNVDKDCKIIN